MTDNNQEHAHSGWHSDIGPNLRDWFAGQAIIGMMQAMRPYSDDYERSARDAYKQADAMIAARKAGGE